MSPFLALISALSVHGAQAETLSLDDALNFADKNACMQ